MKLGCVGTPRPIPQLRKVTEIEAVACEGGLRRKHDVGAKRVSVWGERTKGRNREEEKKGVSSLR